MARPHIPALSIVLPVYNEQNSITKLVKEYNKCGKQYDFELVCVNNGSTDDTGEKLSENAKTYRFIKIVSVKKNKGYGYGILSGVNVASGDVIAWTHADMQTHPSDVFRAFDAYKKHSSTKTLIKGSRYGRPFADSIVSAGMGIIASVFLRMPLSEINAQPKLFHRSFVPQLKNAPYDFSLDLYCLYQARKLTYTIVTIPVRFYTREHGKSKWAYSFRSRFRMIRNTFAYIYSLSKKSV